MGGVRSGTAVRRSLAGALACVSVSCGGGSGSGSGSGAPGPHDDFVMQVGAQTYQYDCAAQRGELPMVIDTVGCSWPAASPILEIDFVVEQGVQPPVPIHEQTFDLASASPDQIEIVAGIMNASGGQDSIYSSWEFPNGVSGPTMVTTPGTTGTVTVHSFDPATGHADITLSSVVLPAATNVSGTYPNSPATVTIVSAEIVR